MDKEQPCIKIWEWRNAPEEYCALSQHGGDEDWVLYVPKDSDVPWGLYEAVYGEEDSYLHGFGHVDRHTLDDGSIVVIFAHA